MIHQDLAHQPGGHAQEVRPVLPVDAGLIHQPQIGFIHQGGGLQGMAGPLAAHGAVGDAPEFALDEGNRLVQTLPVASLPAKE